MESNPQPVFLTASLLLCLVFALVLCLSWIWLRNTAGLIFSNSDQEVAAFIGMFAMAQVAWILVVGAHWRHVFSAGGRERLRCDRYLFLAQCTPQPDLTGLVV